MVSDSKRVVPEAIFYLNKIMLNCIEKLTNEPIDEYQPLSMSLILSKSGIQVSNSSLFIDCLSLLLKFSNLYIGAASFVDLFSPILDTLAKAKESTQLTTSLREKINECGNLNQMVTKSLIRKTLQCQIKKAVAIKSFVPKFSDSYSFDKKSNDPNKERAEKQKLTRQYKKEFRGASRELRKDGEFLQRQRLDAIKEKDIQYKKKIDGIMGGLANQEGIMREFEKKDKKRRRK